MNDGTQEMTLGRDLAQGPSDRYKGREINIQSLNHGWIVRVGCATFAVEEGKDKDLAIGKMLAKIEVYLIDPKKAEDLYNKTREY